MPVTFARQQDQLRGGLTAEQANFCGSPSEGPTCPCRLSWELVFLLHSHAHNQLARQAKDYVLRVAVAKSPDRIYP